MTEFNSIVTECPRCHRSEIVYIESVDIPEKTNEIMIFHCRDCNAMMPVRGPYEYIEVTELPEDAVVGSFREEGDDEWTDIIR